MTTPDPVADARESLRARIDTAIIHWTKTQEVPPFSGTQLVVMALVMNDTPLTRREVWSWIVETFAYYREAASEAFWNCSSEAPYRGLTSILRIFGSPEYDEVTCRSAPKAALLRKMLDEVYRQYDLPIEVTGVGDPTKADVRYAISPLMGERWLNLPVNVVEADMMVFKFFELPAELREVIYKMVFQYPISGVRVFMKNKIQVPEVLSRDLDDSRDWSHMHGYTQRGTLATRPISKILSPLLVSRQFCGEAAPIFFNINTFHFPNEIEMSYLLEMLPRRYCKEIRSISFEMWVREFGFEGYERHFLALTQLPKLRVLKIYMDHGKWKDSRDRGRVPSWDSMTAIDVLRTIRGLEKVECPNCPELQALLQDMCKPKSLADGAYGINDHHRAEKQAVSRERVSKARPSDWTAVMTRPSLNSQTSGV
ncbi:hypothetical protein LTR56_004719 [Elasticomyces elasticus]|nr:hypothetical protein LTR56_004719 [Elasticomyces elasticus]KAK3665574.1 hypothetical protein LTR22_003514 [Elasticomyces elasticus]KAK4930388.1 hypothetical protein LTR49_003129 [Elasticomyces elasticus]KAK5768885.1 hypothetical protein LTS12_000945 [Elasticomyces elasticus]